MGTSGGYAGTIQERKRSQKFCAAWAQIRQRVLCPILTRDSMVAELCVDNLTSIVKVLLTKRSKANPTPTLFWMRTRLPLFGELWCQPEHGT
jgi:hypothetical protein